MTEALVTPRVLRWARERSGISISVLAKKVPIKDEQLAIKWERGEARPTFHQAQQIAKSLHIPFGYLFLSTPPEDKLAIPDLRTFPDAKLRKISPEFQDLINEVLRKQEWFKEYALEEGASPLPFMGRFTESSSPEKIAQDISSTLGIDLEFRRAAHSWEHFLHEFIAQTERVGILVLRSGIVGNNPKRRLSVAEFRGFAVCDDIAPVVFINSRDAKAAQIFTLAHELAHLWLGESGISNPDLSKPPGALDKGIERICNQISAELLVPREHLVSAWNKKLTVHENVQDLVRLYRVSSLVVLRRAFDLGRIGWDTFLTNYKSEMQKALHGMQFRSRAAGGDFYATFFTRHSPTLVQTVISAASQGRLLYREAANLLALKKIDTLDHIAQELGLQ